MWYCTYTVIRSNMGIELELDILLACQLGYLLSWFYISSRNRKTDFSNEHSPHSSVRIMGVSDEYPSLRKKSHPLVMTSHENLALYFEPILSGIRDIVIYQEILLPSKLNTLLRLVHIPEGYRKSSLGENMFEMEAIR
jgi:hypothetical protein